MVTFNASRSTPDGGTIVTYHWVFGDQNNGTGMIVSHAYTGYGNHTVTLTVTDSEGLSNNCLRQIRILIVPVASFTYSPKRPAKNLIVTFNASASYALDGSVVTYHWVFGDQNNGTGMIVGHAYAKEGTYNITLTVTDNYGLTDTTWKLITVYTYTIVHDVATTNVAVTPTDVYPGWKVNINVTVRNEGTEVESFNVTVYYGGISIGTKKVTNMLNDTQITLTFIWNTQGAPPGSYTISANATIAVEDISNNFRTGGVVRIRLLGDVNGDGTVDWVDLGLLGLAYGSRPGDSNWNPYADINGDGTVDWIDLGILGLNYGK
jgi:PKD repeat protein